MAVGDWAGVVATALAVNAAVVVGIALTTRPAVFDRSRCERCGEPSPVGLPQSVRDTVLRLAGGWVCSSCGLECDRWGVATGSKAGPGS